MKPGASVFIRVLLVLALSACASGPKVPDWSINAVGHVERFTEAYLKGDARVEAREFELARAEVARTGKPDLVARVELNRCAARVASLVFEPCAGFEPLRQDATDAERAYANYLAGQVSAQDAALLKLYKDNASTLTPDPLYVRFYYSHPPASERIARMGAHVQPA